MLFSPMKRQLAWIWISDASGGVSQTGALRHSQRTTQRALYQKTSRQDLSLSGGTADISDSYTCRCTGLSVDALDVDIVSDLAPIVDVGDECCVNARPRDGLVTTSTTVIAIVILSENSSHSTHTYMYFSLISPPRWAGTGRRSARYPQSSSPARTQARRRGRRPTPTGGRPA